MAIRTTRYEIFEYWKDKYITPNFEIVEEKYQPDGIPVTRFDEAEPSCWVCGIFRPTPIEGTEDLKKIWNYKNQGLDKCHIVSKQFEGKDEPENLFLLCPRCHNLSPDTKNEKHFFMWVYKERTEGPTWMKNIINEMRRCSKDITGYEFEEIPIFNNNKSLFDMKEVLKNCAFHGRTISDTSLAHEILEDIAKNIKEN